MSNTGTLPREQDLYSWLETPFVAVTVFPRRLCQARALRWLRWSLLEGFDLHGCCFGPRKELRFFWDTAQKEWWRLTGQSCPADVREAAV
jgi:hypothetical protein